MCGIGAGSFFEYRMPFSILYYLKNQYALPPYYLQTGTGLFFSNRPSQSDAHLLPTPVLINRSEHPGRRVTNSPVLIKIIGCDDI